MLIRCFTILQFDFHPSFQNSDVSSFDLTHKYFYKQVSGCEMRKNVDELFTVIIEMLQDASSLVKREVSNLETMQYLFRPIQIITNFTIYFDCHIYLSSGYIIYLMYSII